MVRSVPVRSLGLFMVDSLQKTAIRGLAWSTIERISQQFLHFLFVVVLARLLSPSEFGLIAMVLFIFTVFGAYVYVWRRGGLEWD